MGGRIHVDDVIVLIPGIMGSVLKRDGDVWALSANAIAKGILTFGGSLKAIRLKDPTKSDGIVASAVFPDAHLIPGLWTIDGYTKVANRIKGTFDVTPRVNYFEFPYDWRRDNALAAKELATRAGQWLQSWRDQTKNPEARLIFLAHSQGGLVARYFIERLEGWSDTRMLITFGTPYSGSVKALEFLANGYKIKTGPITWFDFSDAVRSFPSVYQLLPTYPCVGTKGTKKLLTVAEAAGISNLEPGRVTEAFEFHQEIRDSVKKHYKLEKYRTSGYEIHPIVGTDQTTPLMVNQLTTGVKGENSYPEATWEGDSTVPWISAHPLDHPTKVEPGDYFVECHGSLQNSDDVLVQVENLIQRLNVQVGLFRSASRPGIRLECQDLYSADGLVVIRARPARPEDANFALLADVVELTTGESLESGGFRMKLGDDGWSTIRLEKLRAGTYRVTVTSVGPLRSVTNLFSVL